MQTKVFNIISNFTTMRSLNLNHNFLRVALLVLLATLGIGNAWGLSTTYYANLTISKTGETGKGKVYYATSNSKPSGGETSGALKSSGSTTSGTNQTYYWWVDVDPGYNVTLSGKITAGPATAATLSGNVDCAQSSSSGSGTSYSATANIVAVTVNSVDNASIDLTPTNPSVDYPFTVTFETSNLKTIALDLTNLPETTDGKFTITSWAKDGNNVVATGKFNGGDSYGGASRNNSTTVSLQSKASGSTAKTCTVTANFPALAFVGVEATDVYATQGESGKTGSATFTYNYGAEDDFPTAPTLTPVSGTGVFSVTGYTVTPDFYTGTCEVTVDYTYDTNKGVGDTEATLTLTAANGDARSVTIVGHSEAESTNDASVTPAGGSPTEYATFGEALDAANQISGSTLTLLKNIDLGTLAATKNVSKAMTINLNGKTLQANSTAAIALLTINKNVAVTIQDSKSGGMIYNTGEIDGVVYGVTVSKGTLNVTSGTIKAENTQQYFYGTSSVGGTATNKTSVGARGIQQAAATTVTISGSANIQAIASRNAFGIREESSNANTTTLNIAGGTIYAEAPALAYGVYAYGKVNMSNGVVSTKLNTNLVNGNETWMSTTSASKWANNAVHREGHGIYMSTYARAAKTSCYYGTLTMTGGSISVVNENTTLVGTTIQSEPIYGVYFGASVYGVGAGKTATDGTMSQKASAIGSISNATITVNNSSQPSYGVMSYGYYNSADESEGLVNIDNSTVNVTSYQSAYGIYANVGINSDYGGCYAGRMMLENNNVTTTTTTGSTSVALYATSTMTTIKTATNATYAGEYESSAYIYVKSGNYTANSATSYATAAIAGPWTTSNAQRGAFKTYFAVDGSLGGNVESMSGIYISGGKFVANATTSHARGVWNSGTTIIAGGTFEANATTTNAYGIYSNRGVVQATGATLKAVAGTGTAYGVYSDAMINDYVGWKYAADYTLTNCNITATTTTGNTAYGVYINGTTRTISSVNSSYASIGDVVLGGYAIVGNASVQGCTINATSAGTTAGGIYRVNTQVSANKLDICQGELTATGNTITAKTNGGKTVYGIRSGGPSTISNNTITATSSSTDSYGVVVGDGEHTISGNTVTASGTGTVYGIQTYSAVNSTTGYKFQANATLEDNTVTATTTSGNTAYAVYVTTADGVNIASGDFAGDYVAAGSMVINSGKYTATAVGTTGYALALDATKTKNTASGSATCTVNGGKFKGTASSTYADVNASAGLGNLVLAGGYYVVNTNLITYVADGYTATSLTSGDAYTEGYRYQISSEATGAIVCKVYSGSTLKASYQSLEEAIGYVNQNASTTLTILMVDNCTLSEGEYTLPAKATLLVPYSGQTTAKTTSLERVYGYTKPTANIKLSFAPNAHLDVLGTIEAGSKQAGSGQTGGYNGAPHLSYGWIYLSAGSSMTLENGAKLFAWGYVTGAGEIDAKRGSTVYEMFQLTDWRGGTAISGMEGNSQKVMPVNQYYIQNVECPIKFRPGAIELCEGSCNMSSSVYPVRGKNTSTSIQFIGITGSGSLFMMDDEDVSNDTWVRKSYDAVNDKQVYEINSSAKIGGISITCCNLPLIGSKTLSSTDYVMPITNNMKIHLLSGSMYITQNLELAAGAEIEVDKEATAYVNSGVSLYVFDTDEWDVFETKNNSKTYPVRYTPSWTTCPRSASNVPDAAINVHGKFIINGNLYTTASGANIFSTNEDAGSITYNVAAPTGTKTVYVCNNTSQTYNSKTCYPAWLQNGTGITPAYSETASTAAGKTWSYYDDKWQCWAQSGCFTYDALDNKYIKPAAYVQVTSIPDANHLYTDAATGTRKFVWDVDCYWWEVETTPTAEGYYKAINADHNGKYNYYYYDSANDYWVIKTIVVTWSINGSTTNYTVNYGTVPKWLGANPSIAATASVYYSWDGWTKGSTTGTFYSKYEDLPVAKEAVTYYAHFETNKYSYTITFADAYNGASVSKTFTADEIPVCPITPVKAPTTALMYTYDGWSTTSGGSKDYDKDDNLPAVSGTATYYAHFSSSARPYTITFQNYDGTVLQESDVNYGDEPTYDGATPYRAKDAFYSYTFSGWSPAITNVTGDATYTAQYNSTTRGYTIQFLNYDGTVLETKDVPRDQTPEYTGPAFSKPSDETFDYVFNGWSPTLEDVTEDASYTAQFIAVPNDFGPELDIIDWTRTGTSGGTVRINLNGFPAGGWPYDINGTKYYQNATQAEQANSDKIRPADRTLEISYSGTADNPFAIVVKKANDEIYSSHTYTIPHIYVEDDPSEDIISGEKTSRVIFISGGSHSLKKDATVNAIYVAPGAEIVVEKGVELNVQKLVLRTSEWKAASLDNKGTVNATKAYYTRQVSDVAFHQFAIPLASNISDVVCSNGVQYPYGTSWLLKYYDEESRADNGTTGVSNWKVYEGTSIDASVGYELYSGSAFYREFYFPVKLADATGKTVMVSHHDGAAGDAHAGWNALCSPLLGKYVQDFGTHPEDGLKVSELLSDGHYWQHPPEIIYPAVPFYYQAPGKENTTNSSGILDFSGKELEFKQNAPRREWHNSVPTQWLRLTIQNPDGKTLDETSIYAHPEKFSVEYETGYDVAKQSLDGGNALLYSELPCGKLAFAAVPDSLAETRIPLTVYAAAEGEYIFSMVENNYLGRLQYVLLHDTQTGLVTDLLERDCAANLTQGTNAGRFYLQCVFAADAPEVTTGVNHIKSEKDKAQKIIYNDKVYIIYQGRVYDMTGRQCELK